MKMIRRTYSEIEKKAQHFSEHRTKCKCGHSILIATKDGKKLCKWCHEYAFVNKEAEIRYRNKEALLKAKKELENEQRRNDDGQVL